MSVIIKGVIVPKGCGKCHFCDWVWTSPKCHAKSKRGRNIHRKYNMDDYKPDWCPLEEYPEEKNGQTN